MTSRDELKAKAEAKSQMEERYDAWRPNPGDEIFGTMVGGRMVQTANGPATLIVVQPEDGDGHRTGKPVTVWCSSKMLADFVLDSAPAVGAAVLITFVGKFPVSSDPSRSYNKYEAATSESDLEYWDGLRRGFRAKGEELGSDPNPSHVVESTQFGPDTAPF